MFLVKPYDSKMHNLLSKANGRIKSLGIELTKSRNASTIYHVHHRFMHTTGWEGTATACLETAS